MMKRVVITGMGIYSCLGTTLDEVRDALYFGKSGIGVDSSRREMGFRSCLTGILPRPDLKGEVGRHDRSCMPEMAQYAYCATRDALRQAGVDGDYLKKEDVGVIFGNDSTAEAVVKSYDRIRMMKDTTMCGYGSVFQSMNSTVTMNLGCLLGLRGVNLTLSAACASGSHAIGMAALMIRNGMENMIVAGGAQEVNMFGVASFDGMSAFSVREAEPERASRPFDRDRDGLVPSGGGAAVVLEEYEHAVRRGAHIIAEIVGYGCSSNGGHISVPNVDGPAKAMEGAIRQAGVSLNDIGYINAHATATPVGDANEAKALYRVIGDSGIPVTSTKSQTGHEMWMSGASGVIYSILMMQNDFVAANLNFENPDEDSARLVIPNVRLDRHFDCFVSNSFGFGGTNSALVVKGKLCLG